jgi:hypothetical protein
LVDIEALENREEVGIPIAPEPAPGPRTLADRLATFADPDAVSEEADFAAASAAGAALASVRRSAMTFLKAQRQGPES